MSARRTVLRGTSGLPLGPKARVTRQNLLDALAEVLACTPWHLVTVTDVAYTANTSPATFYQYFESLAEAVLELAAAAERSRRTMPEHLEMITGLLRFERRALAVRR